MYQLRTYVLTVVAITFAAFPLPATVFFHDDFDAHVKGPLAGQSAPMGGVWTLFDDNFFALPDKNELVIDRFFGTGGSPGAGQVFNLGELGVALGNSISFPRANSNRLYFQYDMLLPPQQPSTTAGPQFWLEQPGGAVSTVTVNVSSGQVFGEGMTVGSGSHSYGSATRLRVRTTIDNRARSVQYSWWDLDNPVNGFVSPSMRLPSSFHPSKLHLVLNSSQEHIRSAQGFDNIWLVNNLADIIIPGQGDQRDISLGSKLLLPDSSVNEKEVPLAEFADASADGVVTQQLSSSRQAWVRQRIRSLPFMIGGVLEHDRWPGVVDLHPGVQSYLDAGFEYLDVFQDADSRIADIGRDIDPNLPLLVLSNSDPVQNGEFASLVAKHGSDRMMVLRRDEPWGVQMIQEVGNDIHWIRQNFPDVLAFTNIAPFTHEATPGSINYDPQDPIPSNFMEILNPDVFMSDFIGPLWKPGGGTNLAGWIRYLRDHRQLALDHNLPYYTYVGTHGVLNRLPSESDLRMVLFSALAYGYSGFNYLSYSAMYGKDGVVDPDGHPTHVYHSAASANPEVFHLGEVLKFAESRDIFFVPGHHRSAGREVPNPTLYSAVKWDAAIDQDHHIRNISVVESGLEGVLKLPD